MSHASLRYIFRILPLFLVLVPETSSDSDCMTEIRNGYEHILIKSIINLEKMLNQNSTVCSYNLRNTSVVCSSSFKNRSIYYMAACLRKMAKQCHFISADLKYNMENVSHLTLDILNKRCYTIKRQKGQNCRQGIRGSRRADNTCTCCIKEVVSDLRSWWIKFLYYDYP